MPDEPAVKTRSNPFTDVASVLKDYVPRSEHGEALDAVNQLTAENTKLKAALEKIGDPKKMTDRLAELEGKVRDRNYRDAYKGLVEDLKINPEFADEVFELAKLTIDADEPDLKAMKGVLKDFLELKPKFKLAENDAPADADQVVTDKAKPAAKPRLQTAEEGRGSQLNAPNKLRYRGSDLSDPAWMAKNASAYAEHAAAGTLVRTGD
jgi:hypothetical protein